MPTTADKKRPKLVTALIETFGFSPLFATIVALFLVLLAGTAVVWLWVSAPPRTVRMLTGPAGSSFDRYARQAEGANPTARTYEKRLAHRWDLKLQVIPSSGSMDNLKRLAAGEGDVAFVQGGLVGDNPPPNVVSLGSVASQPVWIFYRGTSRMVRLAELAGKRIGVGGPGSGTHALATDLLTRNGITATTATLVENEADDASTALLSGKLDAVFLMGEAASLQTLRTLIRAPEIQLYSFTQADAYVRRIDYLNKIVLPQGSIDFALNLPAQDVVLVGPTIQLLAREGFNGALTDVLLEAAGHVHGKGGLLSRRGEFPAPIKGEYPISPDAERYYKSGLGFTYERVPNFYIASLINRVLVAIVPIALLTIPAIRLLPIAYRWSVQLRIYRCYRPLLRLEREVHSPVTPEEAEELRARLEEIEADVNKLKVPASFAYQFYALRGHVGFVRKQLQAVAGNR